MKNIRTITLFCFGVGFDDGLQPSEPVNSYEYVCSRNSNSYQYTGANPACHRDSDIVADHSTDSNITARATPTPFPGFAQNFKFYQAWTRQETTWFYFMNAYVDQTVYALVDDLEGNSYALICPPDATYPQDLRCYSEELFKGKREYKVSFYSDPEHKYPFYEQVVTTNLDTTYLTYDNCEAEYRIYDGKCYSAITCYGENGEVVYTYDDIPYDGNFEGFSGPCQ